jgi:hypothetical protein
MSVQFRVKSGSDFEKKVCQEFNLIKYDKRPSIRWNGNGRNIFQKILSLNKDPELFYPLIDKSNFFKCDAKDLNGYFYEIKKYSKSDLIVPKLYSEPIIKVAPRRTNWGKGNFILDNFTSTEYNDFIYRMTQTKWWSENNKIILDNITKTCKGIYLLDGYVPNDNFEYNWVINKKEYGAIFENYHRLSIVFNLRKDYI